MKSKLLTLMQRLNGWRLWTSIAVIIILMVELVGSILDLVMTGELSSYSMFTGLIVACLVIPPCLYFLNFMLSEFSKIQQRELELSARHANTRLSIAIENAQMLIWELDLINDELRYDDAMLGLLDITTDVPPHSIQSWLSFVHPDDRASFIEHFQAALKTGDPLFDLEYRYIQKEGQWGWAHTRGQVIQRDFAGNPLLSVGSTLNVTARKQAENKFQQNEVLLRSTLESTDEGILMIAQDGRVLSANKRFMEIWHVPQALADNGQDDQLLAHVLDQLVDPDGFLALVKRLYESEDEARDTLHFKDGRVFTRYTRALFIGKERGRIWCFKDITEQARAQSALVEREEIFRSIVTQANDGIALINAETQGFVEFNDTACMTLGYSREEFAKLTIADIQGVMNPSMIAKNLRTILETGSGEFETLHRHKDGTLRHVRVSNQALHVLGHQYVAAIITDITDRKHREMTIADSNNLLMAIINTAPVRIFWKDNELRYMGCNSSFATDAGVATPQDVIGKNDYQLGWKEQAEIYRADDKKVMESGIPKLSYDEPQTTPDGNLIWLRTSKVPLLNEVNETIGILGIYEDITTYKRADEALLASEQKLLTILDNVDAYIYLKDKEGRYLFANRHVRELWNAEMEDIVGCGDEKFFDAVTTENIRRNDRRVLDHGETIKSEEPNALLSTGDTATFLSTKLPLRREDGTIYALCGISTDITDLKIIENELKQIKERYDFATMIGKVGTWDWSPLTGVLVWSDETFRLMGYVPGSIIPTYELYLGLVHPDDREYLNSGVQAALHEKIPYSLDCRIVLESGKNLVCHVTGKVEFDANDQPTRMLGTIQDITERKLAEEALRSSESHANNLAVMLRLISDNVPDMIWAKDLNKRFLFANKAICEQLLSATDTSEPLGKDDMFFALRERKRHSDDPHWHTFGELCQDSDAITLEQGKPSQFDEYGNIQGKFLFLDVHKAPFVNEKGEVIGVVGSARDVTEQKAADEKLQLASLVLQNSSEAMFVTDANSRIVDINPAFTKLTGYGLDEVMGKNPNILHSGRQSHDFYREMWSELERTGRWQGEIWNRRKNGDIYAEWQTVNTVYHEDGSIDRRVTLFSDITEKKKSDEVIWNQANFDYLTKLPNRRMFRDRLLQDIKKTHRSGLKLALLFLDLDNFKEVNDSLGHDLGDSLLVEAAQRISACVRESDTVARLGGDEFTIILTELDDTSHVERIAENIIQSLNQPFHLHDEHAYVSASIGITLYPDDATEVEGLLKNADQSMFVSKRAGRNRFSYFTNTMQEAAQHRLHIINDLRIALADAQFQLYYQPIVDLQTGEIHKAEALLRWFHPTRGMISPAEFIPLAEESGIIHELGDWVFTESVKQARHWQSIYGTDFQISMNVSPVQMQAKNNISQWLHQLNKTGLSGQNFVFEITEGLLLDTTPHITAQLLSFRDAGIQVAIDDFGTGYSSLSYLKRLDIDYLKIDQSFIANLAPESSDMALCEAIVVMAHKLGLKVIAEGVETAEQNELLSSIGCDYVQGYFHSKPLPTEQFETFLSKCRSL